MRVGTLCFATDQGLGILAKSFYDHDIVTDVLVIRHGRHPEHDEWYPDSPRIGNLKSREDIKTIEDFCSSMDVMLFFETPFLWSLLNYCHVEGVATALMPMYECTPSVLPAQPDQFICPSLLDLRYFPNRSTFIPVPVPDSIKWRQRTRAEVFIHRAGHGGLAGRNGTAEVIEAWKYVKSDIRLVLYSQGQIQSKGLDPRIELRIGTLPYETLWDDGDVLLFPERHNGLSLPLQEAYAAGMLVMAGDRFPMNTWLPREPLIPIAKYTRHRIGPPYLEYDRAEYDPLIIASKVEEWYKKDISALSLTGKEWGEMNSWKVLKPLYLNLLES